MDKFDYDAKYFNPAHTLECGQIFRFRNYKKGYLVLSRGKACYVYTENGKTYAECDDGDYFYNFFDLARDYSGIVGAAKSYSVPLLSRSAEKFCGLRLLNQNREEMIYSFIISQNNNIPRIKKIIEKICDGLGEKFMFGGQTLCAFPETEKLASAGVEFFKAAGCGYRDVFLDETAKRIQKEGVSALENADTCELKRLLLTYKGIGGKVADCISLFGFSKRDSFPVDTWIMKAYKEDFGGQLNDPKKVTEYFKGLFGEYSGYMQQYLFYGKRENL